MSTRNPRSISRISVIPMLLALTLAAALLLSDAASLPERLHAGLSAAPLALAGVGYAGAQFHLRPPGAILWKRLLLAATFVTWGVVQWLGAGRLAMVLGDAVIAAYVLDLTWMVGEQLGGREPGV